jgi:hypothetical protein
VVTGGGYGALAGEVQTIPRGELQAATIALAHTKGDVRLLTDAAYVVKGFAKGPEGQHECHADLWHEFWQAVKSRSGSVVVHKIKSHQDGSRQANSDLGIQVGPTRLLTASLGWRLGSSSRRLTSVRMSSGMMGFVEQSLCGTFVSSNGCMSIRMRWTNLRVQSGSPWRSRLPLLRKPEWLRPKSLVTWLHSRLGY